MHSRSPQPKPQSNQPQSLVNDEELWLLCEELEELGGGIKTKFESIKCLHLLHNNQDLSNLIDLQ